MASPIFAVQYTFGPDLKAPCCSDSKRIRGGDGEFVSSTSGGENGRKLRRTSGWRRRTKHGRLINGRSVRPPAALASSSLRFYRLIVSSRFQWRAFRPPPSSLPSSQASVTCGPLMFSVAADRLYVSGCAGVLRGFLLTQPLACSLCLTSFGLPPAFNGEPFDSRAGQDVRSKIGPGSLTFFFFSIDLLQFLPLH